MGLRSNTAFLQRILSVLNFWIVFTKTDHSPELAFLVTKAYPAELLSHVMLPPYVLCLYRIGEQTYCARLIDKRLSVRLYASQRPVERTIFVKS